MAEIWTIVAAAELQLRETAVFTAGDVVTRRMWSALASPM
jgi:hypothetical protein